MYTEDDLLPISALQHLAFCERQCALIHVEGQWEQNRLTVEGGHLHDRAHEPDVEMRGDVRLCRGLNLHCFRLGLVGKADMVEFHRVTQVLKENLALFSARAACEAADLAELAGQAPSLEQANEALARLEEELEHLRPALANLGKEVAP